MTTTLEALDRLEGLRVLIVEDEALIAESLKERLTRLRCDVLGIVDSGEAAVQAASELSPDLVLADIRLSGSLDGIDAARIIQERAGAAIVYLSAYSDPNTVERAMSTDPAGYVLKPVRDPELMIALEMALRRQQRRQPLQEGDEDAEAPTTDVERKRLLEEQLLEARKLKAAGALAGGIAHDFNNLLSVIAINCDLLQETSAGSEPFESGLVESIRRAVAEATRITDELLTFSQVAGTRREVLDLAEVVRTVARELRPNLRDDQRFEVSTGVDERWVRINRLHLEEVVRGLCANALDAVGGIDGRGRIELFLEDRQPSSAEPAASGDFVCLGVRDDGRGIDPEIRDRLFEPYFSTKEGGRRKTGLGLAAIHGVVAQSGGLIEVESKPEEGATFRVFLPLADGPLDRTSAADSADVESRPRTVLLVEDEVDLREVIRTALSRAGMEVVAAGDGRAALEAWDEHGGMDVVVSDVVMPRMGGRELAERLRERDPEVPVLLMSGFDPARQGQDRDDSEPFLAKPFTATQLMNAIEALLRRPR